MMCLVVVAHPVHGSLCRALAQHAIPTLAAHGHAGAGIPRAHRTDLVEVGVTAQF